MQRHSWFPIDRHARFAPSRPKKQQAALKTGTRPNASPFAQFVGVQRAQQLLLGQRACRRPSEGKEGRGLARGIAGSERAGRDCPQRPLAPCSSPPGTAAPRGGRALPHPRGAPSCLSARLSPASAPLPPWVSRRLLAWTRPEKRGVDLGALGTGRAAERRRRGAGGRPARRKVGRSRAEPPPLACGGRSPGAARARRGLGSPLSGI
jgi:hypothetical protein